MLYNKKGLFLRRITAKIVGSGSHKQRKGDKCHTAQRAPSAHHHQNKEDHRGLPDLTFLTNKQSVTTSSFNSIKDMTAECKPAVSGLVAAKMQCNEWGLDSSTKAPLPKQMSTVSSQATSTSSSPKRRRHPVHRSRVVSKQVHHPSYKPSVVQRSCSMKERRESMENARKYHNLYFSTSLYRIDEVDEIGPN